VPEDNAKIIWYLMVWLIAAALVFFSQLRTKHATATAAFCRSVDHGRYPKLQPVKPPSLG
jgi:hypothetical protein